MIDARQAHLSAPTVAVDASGNNITLSPLRLELNCSTEFTWEDLQLLFVVAVIGYNREYVCVNLGPEVTTLFLCYSREFVITVIVITKFDCIINTHQLSPKTLQLNSCHWVRM